MAAHVPGWPPTGDTSSSSEEDLDVDAGDPGQFYTSYDELHRAHLARRRAWSNRDTASNRWSEEEIPGEEKRDVEDGEPLGGEVAVDDPVPALVDTSSSESEFDDALPAEEEKKQRDQPSAAGNHIHRAVLTRYLACRCAFGRGTHRSMSADAVHGR
jgi:hypothetical protein